ncbi:MAG: hypothetical protein WBF79_06730, partial [Rhodococcus sp. (in: high G+C Gram-positive bacteria)]
YAAGPRRLLASWEQRPQHERETTMSDWAKKLEDKAKGLVAEAEVELTHLEGADAVDLDQADSDTEAGGSADENDAPSTGMTSADPDISH